MYVTEVKKWGVIWKNSRFKSRTQAWICILEGGICHILHDMGSTQIINQTSKPLDMKVGNYRYFTKLATVDANKSYTVHVKDDDTYMEYSLGADDGAGNAVIVNSDECVDNKTITVREVNGKYDVQMEPRSSSASEAASEYGPTKKTYKWRFWEHI